MGLGGLVDGEPLQEVVERLQGATDGGAKLAGEARRWYQLAIDSMERAEQGKTLRAVYNITLGSTGREVVFSGITTLLALGTFFLLPMEAMRMFGLVMFIAIFYSIMGALVLTPLMLRYWGPKEAKEQAEGADQG